MKLSYDEMARAKRAFIQNLPESVVLSYYEIECLIQAVHGALAQQAQPLTDEMIERQIEATVCFDDTPFDAARNIAQWIRDRMAQQAQPECKHGSTIPHEWMEDAWDGPHHMTCEGPQPEPLTDVDLRQIIQCIDDGEPIDPDDTRKLAQMLRDRMAQQALPEMPTREQIAKWRAWWLAMADEAANAGTQSGDYNARVYRDIIEDFDRTTNSP